MKKYEQILTACKWCVDEVGCEGCPYHHIEDGCTQLKKDIIEFFEEMKAQPEQLATECNYEGIAQSHSEEIRKLHDKLADAEITLERTQRELAEAQRELIHLRTVKATAEAFLGKKINVYM